MNIQPVSLNSYTNKKSANQLAFKRVYFEKGAQERLKQFSHMTVGLACLGYLRQNIEDLMSGPFNKSKTIYNIYPKQEADIFKDAEARKYIKEFTDSTVDIAGRADYFGQYVLGRYIDGQEYTLDIDMMKQGAVKNIFDKHDTWNNAEKDIKTINVELGCGKPGDYDDDDKY